MENLRFCPKCGTNNLHWDNNIKWFCSNCDFVLFHNCAAAVAVIITYKNELFFTVRNQNPEIGKLDLPGGFSDPKESSEETCSRELHEELGISIDINKLNYLGSRPNIYPYKNIIYNTLDLFYEYESEEKFEVKLEISEISETVWLKIKDINPAEIAFENQLAGQAQEDLQRPSIGCNIKWK